MRQKFCQAAGAAYLPGVGQTDEGLRIGKFQNALETGAARRDKFLTIGQDENGFYQMFAAGYHGGNGSLFGTAAAGKRYVFDIAAAVYAAVAAENGRSDAKRRIWRVGPVEGKQCRLKKFLFRIHVVCPFQNNALIPVVCGLY